MRPFPRLIAAFALLLASVAATPMRAAPLLVKDGETVGFMGDSITAQGDAPDGYIGLTVYALKQKGVNITAIPAGVPGHTSSNMRARTGPQILDQHADWMTLSCGVNDVMHQAKGHGAELEDFKKNVAAIAEAAAECKVRLILLTPTPTGEDLTNENNVKLAGYVEFLCAYAKEHHLPLADMNASFRDYLQTPSRSDEKPGARLLADGIHPNSVGQTLMAETLLLCLGLTTADIPAIAVAWAENPQGKRVRIAKGTFAFLSPKQFDALEKKNPEHHGNAPAIVAALWKKAVEQSGETDPAKANAAAQAKLGALIDEQLK